MLDIRVLVDEVPAEYALTPQMGDAHAVVTVARVVLATTSSAASTTTVWHLGLPTIVWRHRVCPSLS